MLGLIGVDQRQRGPQRPCFTSTERMPQGFERTAALKREGGGKRAVLGQLDKGRFLWRVEKDFRDTAVGKAAECRRPFAPVVLEIDEFRAAAIGEAFAIRHYAPPVSNRRVRSSRPRRDQRRTCGRKDQRGSATGRLRGCAPGPYSRRQAECPRPASMLAA